MASGPKALPKMMLGFVVRRCAVDVGHQPTAEEFAAWANEQRDGVRTFCLFGRPISVPEARLILETLVNAAFPSGRYSREVRDAVCAILERHRQTVSGQDRQCFDAPRGGWGYSSGLIRFGSCLD